ncbi:putative ATP-dependent RNA helicase DHR1 [Lunasporangiospora selenospora]|uniref:RNA helicase n=1 Tax=Lunasporangiospora selenospora TaxID=979761 RepID=A0A9P6FXZ4_9FUNG|nr:putative ATP-dependent RNA helicase DHR1 [Lunasporangiospora selenospora]
MGRNRPRFNERARQSGNSSSSRPHANPRDGGRKATKPTALQPEDTNALVLVPGAVDTEAMKYNEEAVKPKMSSKKKKRLEKYIDKKLKKDARGDLFKKLEEQAWTSNLLKSSRTLGQNKETMKQKLRRALNEERLGLERSDADVRLYTEHSATQYDDYMDEDGEDSDGSDGSDDESGASFAPAKQPLASTQPIIAPAMKPATTTTAPGVTGSALKVGASILVRKSTAKKPSRLALIRAQKEAARQKERESSFDSSNSEYDSSEDGDDESDNGSKDAGNAGDKHGASDDEGESTEEPAKKKRRGWMTDLGGMATGTEDDGQERIISNIDNLPERTEEYVSARVEPKRDLLGNRVIKIQQLEKGEITEAFNVHVDRDPDIQETRLQLPVVTEEQYIMEQIRYNDVVIIKGETGSGKTTQVPQFLYEAGYGNPNSPNPGMIGITQPRRVAAVSMADRVAKELNLPASKVSHQIRYDATTSPETVMKFMTDGVLLRELNSDFLLRRYSVIIIDEAHERSLNTDILIGALSRIVRLRREESRRDPKSSKPLKLIIMSATLVIEEFTKNERLFGHLNRKKKSKKSIKGDSGDEDDSMDSADEGEEKAPKDLVPVVSVDVKKIYGVTLHFNKKTPEVDYVTEAYKKISKIHTRLPEGGILVFLSGQAEIMTLVKKLRKKFPFPEKSATNASEVPLKKSSGKGNGAKPNKGNNKTEPSSEETNQELDPRNEDVELEDMTLGDSEAVIQEAEGAEEDDEKFDLEASDSEEELLEGDEVLEESPDAGTAPLHVLPLYSLLKTEDQMRVFEPPPPGSRLCVVATNVAETSITIPNIKYVIDSGKSKERHYDKETGIQTFQVGWTSKASATQRAGRAGRTGHGHCYRLYSSAVYEHEFQKASEAEIQKMPIDGIVLQMKSMYIDNVVNFPFPTPPDREDLKQAEQRLIFLNALENSNKKSVTELGKTMSIFPLVPRLAKMLTLAHQENCFPYIIAIVAALSVGEIFIKEFQLDISRPGDSDDESDNEKETINRQQLDDLDDMELQHIRNEKVLQKEQRRRTRQKFYKTQTIHEALDPLNDLAKILNVVGAYARESNKEQFCAENFVRYKAMQEVHQLRGQLTRLVQDNFGNNASAEARASVSSLAFDPFMPKPTSRQLTAIRQIVACSFLDQIAIRKDLIGAVERQYSKAKTVPYVTMWSKESVYIHPSSGLFGFSVENAPAMIVYQDLQRTIKAVEIASKPSKIYLKGLTAVNPKWMANLANGTGLVRASKDRIIKIDDKAQKSLTEITYGPHYWQLPPVEVWQRREGTRLVPMSKAEITAKKLQISRKANR